MEDTDFVFTSDPPAGTQCAVCMNVWRDPVMFAPCEHVVCKACAAQVATCPECRGPVADQRAPPRALMRVVDSLTVQCLRCPYDGVYEGIAAHAPECPKLPPTVVARRRAARHNAQGKSDLALRELKRGMVTLTAAVAAVGGRAANLPEAHADEMQAVALAVAFAGAPGAEPAEAVAAAELAVALDGGHPEALELCARLVSTHGGPERSADATAFATRAVRAAGEPKHDTPFSYALLNPPTAAAATGKAPKGKKSTSTSAGGGASRGGHHVDPSAAGVADTATMLPPSDAGNARQAATFRTREEEADAKLDRLARNMYALAAAQWKQVGAALTTHVKTLPDGGPDALAFVRNGASVLVPRPGQVTTEDGDDASDVVHRCAELNLRGLADGRCEGLLALTKSVVEAGSWREALMRSVRDVMPCVEDQSSGGKRRLWLLRTHPTSYECSSIVDAVSGESVDDKLQFRGNSETDFQDFVMRQQANKANFTYIPRYARIHALERTRLILDAALGWMSAFTTDPSAPRERLDKYAGWRPPSYALGCLACGAKPADTVCKTCACARYCSPKCMRADAAASHEPVCTTPSIFSSVSPEAVQAKIRSMMPELVNDRQFKVVKELCDWKLNERDGFGDGDQSNLGPCKDPRGKPNEFRRLRAEGLDFHPGKFTPFMSDCFFGDLPAVQRRIAECGDDADERFKLVNLRESLMRMSPLLGCICGAKLVGTYLPPRSSAPPQFEAVAEALIAAGSKADAKDVLGFSTVHHAAAGNCTDASLRLLPVLVENGADPNARNRIEELAMSEAVIANRPEACRALIQVGADHVEPSSFAMMFPDVRQVLLQCGPLKGLKPGDTIIIKGLVRTASLNGTAAVIQPGRHYLGCYKVLPEGRTDPVLLKMQNLERPGDGHLCAACNKPATQRCSSCKGVSYCSRECQLGHWKAHKADCKRLKEAGAQGSIIIPKITETQHMTDVFAGSAIRAPRNDAQKVHGDKTFVVKAQVPLTMPAMTPAKSGPVALYDQQKTFWWSVQDTDEKWRECNRQLIAEVGKIGPKAYYTAKFRANGDLEILLPATAMQPW